jgi:CBS-domain-containing membrane protein
MSSLITRLDLDDRLTTDNIRRYALQCSLATMVVLILLVALDAVTQTVLIAALGASTFIAFAVPRSVVSNPRCLIGGYLVGIFAGSILSSLNTSIGISDPVMAEVSMIRASPCS